MASPNETHVPVSDAGPGRLASFMGMLSITTAALTYLGAVSTTGWFVFVLPAIVFASAVAARVSRRTGLVQGLALGALTAVGWAVAVKVSGYSMGGSVARSPLFAGPLAAVAAAALARNRLGLFAAAIGALPLVGWTIRGAQYHAGLIASAVVLTMITVTLAEHDNRRWVSGGHRLGAWLAIATVGATSAVTAYALVPRDTGQSTPGTPDDPVPEVIANRLRQLAIDPWILLLATVLLLLIMVWLIRLLIRRRGARRLRVRLSGEEPALSVQNAWVWTIDCIRGAGVDVPADLAPDDTTRLLRELPDAAVQPMQELAALTTLAAFTADPNLTEVDAARGWRLAEGAVSAVRASRPLAHRLALR